MMLARPCNAVLAILVLAILATPGCARRRVVEVPNVESEAETGRAFVTDARGRRWFVYKSEEHQRVYFSDPSQPNRTTWEDPRTLPLTDQDRAGLDAPEQLAELEANYSRVLLEARGGVGLGWKHSRTALAAAVVLPLALLAAATASRVWYLKTYHPELLFPSKERKQRRRQQSKYRAPKARGKLNQDGKGGRSANT